MKIRSWDGWGEEGEWHQPHSFSHYGLMYNVKDLHSERNIHIQSRRFIL